MPNLPRIARFAVKTLANLPSVAVGSSTRKEERKVVNDLAAVQRQLIRSERGEVDTKSEAGQVACAKFLDLLASVADELQCEAASRSYREQFTTNYRILFPDSARRYRTDVLEASVERLESFWVNGNNFRLSNDALRSGKNLQQAWQELGSQLQKWSSTKASSDLASFKVILCRFDAAWACFESEYIFELIKIEEKARSVIVEAVDWEKRLRRVERMFGKASIQSSELRRCLAKQVAHLNSVANKRRKGRDDLSAEVVNQAYTALADEVSDCKGAAHAIARIVVDSFEALCQYFAQAQSYIERIDPYLGNNAGLVEKLVDWEESWEIGNRYLQDHVLLNALCSIVVRVREEKQAEPAFAAMLQECDAEFFVVFPRILWLIFLQNPQDHAAFFSSIIPDVFECSDGIPSPKEELNSFIDKFRSLQKDIAHAATSSGALRVGDTPEDFAFRSVLMDRAIHGSSTEVAWLRADSATHEALQVFMRELEQWSMRLQRHCPEDWNQSCAVVLRCLGYDWREEGQSKKFRV